MVMSVSTQLPIALRSTTTGGVRPADGPAPRLPLARELTFEDLYRSELAFVWRSARRLGARDAALDDIVQEVFVVVHRRLATFEARSSLRTWLFGITLRIVRDHLRATRRKRLTGETDPDTLITPADGPHELAERAEAVQLLHAVLDELEDERREVFVMAELEQLPVPEIAGVLGINVNTAYARLRLARQAFEAGVARRRARDEWRLR
jgi:RNA polymerase sigma-70 factor, ECF subfamily